MRSEQYIAIREHYESEIANSVIQNPELVPAVKKISKAIIELIDANLNLSIDLTKESIAIEEEIYHPDYFGRIDINKNTCNTPIKTLQDLRAILVNDQSPLELVMHVHAVFMGKVYDKLHNKIPASLLGGSKPLHPSYSQETAEKVRQHPNQIKAIKFEVVKKIFYNELFFKSDKIDRSRQLKTEEAKKSNLIGISRSEFFMNLAHKSDYEHLRAADRFIVDPNANYTREATKQNLPLVAGPSGNAGGLLLCAIVCGDLSQEEMLQYTLATASYLEGGGNHAFHEVMSVANKVGVPHTLGEYESSLPDTYRKSFAYKQIKNQFRELLRDYIQQEQIFNHNYYDYEYEKLYQQFTGEPLQGESRIKNNGTCKHSWTMFDDIGVKPEEKQKTCKSKAKLADNGRHHLHSTYPTSVLTSNLENPVQLTFSSSDTTGNSKGSSNFIVTSSASQVSSGFLDLLCFAASKFGFYQYSSAYTADIQLQHSSNEQNANQILLRETNMSLDQHLHILCGKLANHQEEQIELIKNLLIDVVNKNISPDIGKQYDIVITYQNSYLRWKALLKLAKQHRDQYNPVDNYHHSAYLS